ncbi:hypothetical protein ASE20_17195 [Nocardioides sp. Root240]|nr:hypothetical protein ASE20_17195 [Nocardioides sp. Root240]
MPSAVTPSTLRSTHVWLAAPSSSTSSPSAESDAVTPAPRSSTRVGPSSVLTSTKPGSRLSPDASRPSSTSSKAAPPSTSAHSATTWSFCDAGSSTVALAPNTAYQSPVR